MKSKIEETTELLISGELTKKEADKILLDLHNVSKREIANYVCKTIDEAKDIMRKEKETYSNYSFMLGRKDYAESILIKFT